MELDLIKVGSIVKLKKGMVCMRNSPGTKAVCYEEYHLGSRSWSFIFHNGEYCGFPEDEMPKFFDEDYLAFCPEVSHYKFTNVMQLSRDFDSGTFKECLS